jgi:type I restriction enzyme R subunit
MFMRSVHSRVLFEQMKGRGVRVMNSDELRAVTPDAKAKTHFLIVDCVGVTEKTLSDTKPLEKNPSLSLKALLDHVAAGGVQDDYLSSLASRLARIDKQCGPEDKKLINDTSGGVTLASISGALVAALDEDQRDYAARQMFRLGDADSPTEEQINKAAAPLKKAAIQALMAQPPLRKLILDLRQKFEQIVDEVSKDTLIHEETGFSAEAREKAAMLVKSFESYLKENRGEIDALQFFYSVPHKKRLRFKDIQALASAISAPPRSWTPEKLWRAYETLEKSKVRGASAQRLLTDIVSLVRFALHKDGELIPHTDRVHERYDAWLAQQANKGRAFSAEQVQWLGMMRDHIATSLEIDLDSLDLTPFTDQGGLARASTVFGKDLNGILKELNEVLAA